VDRDNRQAADPLVRHELEHGVHRPLTGRLVMIDVICSWVSSVRSSRSWAANTLTTAKLMTPATIHRFFIGSTV
jgi:hypothetical protein